MRTEGIRPSSITMLILLFGVSEKLKVLRANQLFQSIAKKFCSNLSVSAFSTSLISSSALTDVLAKSFGRQIAAYST
ncbi:hypothetical protein Lal_00022569 [Lupinus albus]|nr:hypothetical protein Lal_00022569 [Lupinus albus]